MSGGLAGGEWNSANVRVKVVTEGTVMAGIGKTARTKLAIDVPPWLTLLIYGCETWLGDVQQDCEDGIFAEPHWSPIWRQQSLSAAFSNCRGTKHERLGVPSKAKSAVTAQNVLRDFIRKSITH